MCVYSQVLCVCVQSSVVCVYGVVYRCMYTVVYRCMYSVVLCLCTVFINDLVSELPSGVKAALYADDLVLWCKEEHASKANYRIQQAIGQLTA